VVQQKLLAGTFKKLDIQGYVEGYGGGNALWYEAHCAKEFCHIIASNAKINKFFMIFKTWVWVKN